METENDSPDELPGDIAPPEQATIEDAELVQDAASDSESGELSASSESVPVSEFDQANQEAEVPFAAVAESTDSADSSNAKNYSADLPKQFQNVAAKGGAVAAVTLGLLTIFGAFVTQWSIFNAMVGLGLGIWGLSSPLKRTTWLGLGLCVGGLFLCVILYSEF